MADLQELLIAFFVGLTTGIIPVYIGHKLSVKRSKREQFSPYLQRLYSIVSKIMSKTDAQGLSQRYKTLLNAMIEKEMRESAMKKLDIEPSNVFERFDSSFVAYSSFVISFNSLIETIRECREFESTFSDMEQKGMLPILRLRDQKLYDDLNWFHAPSSYIVKETKDIADELRTTTEASVQTKAGSLSQSQVFQRLVTLDQPIRGLFAGGASLEKRLRKYV